ncbi:hypothetical protein F0P96_18265 [Hymenobacter busanensis]|uniref:Uncharacterized protein n=1 Tax=Hymenobacter busanensis TaxID=2607656 RepID=A0A7L4ZS49_9BACT|nr:curli-like amyloid fiber formation chaperone CsgH [Hymenobacter busanensis]KAA9327182.1 hypothetical protein F0P96_18265 [Hymenobacter busanensis]QHJ05848.1 hypothetical protein GUY19_00465 [Hymenobacter busanensis]
MFHIPFLLVLLAATDSSTPVCHARLELIQTGLNLTIAGHCQNATNQAAHLRYELLTEKRGRSGSSRNAQSGGVEVAPGQDVVLSRTTINLDPRDFYRVHLRLLDAQGTVVAADSVVHQPAR